MNRREAIIKAILDLHFKRCLEHFPDGVCVDEASLREHINTYRPLAEEEADAILAALEG